MARDVDPAEAKRGEDDAVLGSRVDGQDGAQELELFVERVRCLWITIRHQFGVIAEARHLRAQCLMDVVRLRNALSCPSGMREA